MDEQGRRRVGKHAAVAARPEGQAVDATAHPRAAGAGTAGTSGKTSGARHASRAPAAVVRRGAVPDEGSHARLAVTADSPRDVPRSATQPGHTHRAPEGKSAPSVGPDNPRRKPEHSAAGNNPLGEHAPYAWENNPRKKRKRARLTPLGRAAIGAVALVAVVAVVMLLPRGDDESHSRLADNATLPPDETGLPAALPAEAELVPDDDMAEDFSLSADGPDVAASTDDLSDVVEPTAEPAWLPRPMGEIVPEAQPELEEYGYEYRIVADGGVVDSYERAEPIAMGQGSDYGAIEGVLCFRGNNYRDGPVYGSVPNDPDSLRVVWSKRIGSIDDWTGVGWTGQAAIVRWPVELRAKMNISDEKRAKAGLREVILGTLDGNIYFLDLDDGEETRPPIAVPSSIKGSVSVDPRGIPLLYCGQDIDTVKGREVELGTRIFSLIDQRKLFFLDGRDDFCLRHWYAFDCSPLVDAASDTLIHLGENGILYTISLNTQYDAETGALSIDPVVDRQVYKSGVSTRPGMENSPVVYDHYAYYTDNSGLFTCMDLNTLTPVWLRDVGDDSDGTMVLEEDDEGVWIYTACELDLRGRTGDAYCRKINALTGELIWEVGVPCTRYDDDVDAGGFASPAIGKGSLGELVYFNICRAGDNGLGHLGALSKATGEVVWQVSTGSYSWSSPVCVYDENGRGYVIYCNAGGMVRLLDGLTGKVLAQLHLEGNIEASPAVFDDMLVVGTRARRIYGIRIG